MTKLDEIIVKFIIDYYSKTQFYPNYDEIAEGINRAKATVHTHMKKLEDEGIIMRKASCSPYYRLINMGVILRVNNMGLPG